jgi:deoxyribonuclease V
MILAIDVHYHNTRATAAGVIFPFWESEIPIEELFVEIESVAEYLPGQFYLRELPCRGQSHQTPGPCTSRSWRCWT